MKTEHPLIHRVRSTLSAYHMAREGDLLVVAVSGGADSVCLLDVLTRLSKDLGLELVVAHFDHGLRGEEDASDTRFVEDLARERGLVFDTERAAHSLRDLDGSLEERAREARYAFLDRIRERHRARAVATAHTLDDQAETVLMRFLRGAGPAGLAAIPPVRAPGIIRPLIRVRRRDIEHYLRERGMRWRTDPSNLQPCHLRNRLRQEILPLLLDYQPRLVEHLGELADQMREEDTLLDTLAEEWVDAHSVAGETGELVLQRIPLAELPAAFRRRVIRQALERTAGGLRGIQRGHVASAEALLFGNRPQAGVDLPGGRCARRSYDQLVFGPRRREDRPDYCVRLPCPGEHAVEAAGLSVRLEEKPRHAVRLLDGAPWTAFLDAGLIRYPLDLRPWRAGDRFMPLGMQGQRKVKDFLIDRKVPREERVRIPLLISDGKPVWLCGQRIDERFKVTEKTDRVLEVRIEPLG